MGVGDGVAGGASGGRVVSGKDRSRVRTHTTPPVCAHCSNCELHWFGPRSARHIAHHAAETGHEGWTWGAARVWRDDEPESAAPAVTEAGAAM